MPLNDSWCVLILLRLSRWWVVSSCSIDGPPRCFFKTEGGTWAASVGSRCPDIVPDLLVGLVSSHGPAAVKIRVDAGIQLVGHVALVRTAGVGCGTGPGADRAAAVTVRVDARVGSVGHAAAVWAVGAFRRAVGASHAGDAGAGAACRVMGASCAGTETGAEAGAGASARRVVGASRAGAKTGGAEARAGASADGTGVVAVRVDARVYSVGDTAAMRAVCAFGGASTVTAAAKLSVACSATGAGCSAGCGAGGGAGAVASVSELSVASGAAGADSGGVIAVRVHAGVGGVGDTAVVRAVGAFRGAVGLAVAVDGLLDLVDDA